MDVFVIRHAKAESRSRWDGDDRDRPLTDKGRAQARALVGLLERSEITRVISSPYRRCIETVAPLAERLGVTLEADETLAEGQDWADALRIVESATAPVALCSHGDVIGHLIDRLVLRGVPVDDDRLEKGSTWVLQIEAGDVTKARYLGPPG